MPSAGNSLFSLQKAHNLSIAQPTELRNIGLSDWKACWTQRSGKSASQARHYSSGGTPLRRRTADTMMNWNCFT